MAVVADFAAIETGLYSKLGTSGGTVLWGSTAGTARIYADQAKADATAPYVVFFLVSGGDENDHAAGSFDVRYQVECWSTVVSQARSGATYIQQALHHQTLTISGCTNFWTVQTRLVRSVENVDGVQWYRRGGEYQIRGS